MYKYAAKKEVARCKAYCCDVLNRLKQKLEKEHVEAYQVPYSKKLDKKIAAIRRNGSWADVEEAYLDLKNMYLRRGDKHHPSFIVLAEAVNQVYQSAGR